MTEITNIKNERGDITTEFISIKRIIRKHYEQLFSYKFNNLDDTDKLLKRQATKAHSRRNR